MRFPRATYPVIHCNSLREAEEVKNALAKRMKEIKLELHPTKTQIVYCSDKDRKDDYPVREFDFLGYTFKAMYIKCRDGLLRNNFIAYVSKKSAKNFRDKIKAMELHKRTGSSLAMISEMVNPIIRGWINYFGKYNPSAMKYSLDCIDRRLVKWVMCKFKHFRGHRRLAEKWLSEVKNREPNLFAHWKLRFTKKG